MTYGLFALTVQRKRDITKSASSANYSCMCFGVCSDIVESPKVNDEMTALTTQPMRTITVTAGLGSDLDVVLDTTRDRILYMFDCLWDSISCWCERYTEIEGLGSLRSIRGGGCKDRDLRGGQAVVYRRRM